MYHSIIFKDNVLGQASVFQILILILETLFLIFTNVREYQTNQRKIIVDI